MSTWFTAKITAIVDDMTFDVTVEQAFGPYATDVRPNERVRMVNNEVNQLRPQFLNNPYQRNELVGRRIKCEIHSRSPMQLLVVTATPL